MQINIEDIEDFGKNISLTSTAETKIDDTIYESMDKKCNYISF